MVQTRSSGIRKTRVSTKNSVTRPPTKRRAPPAAAKKKQKRRITPLNISAEGIEIPIQLYEDGDIKDIDQYHTSLQRLIRRRVASIAGYTKGYVPFSGRGHSLHNANTTKNLVSKPMELKVEFDHGTLPIKLFQDGRLKDYHYYPEALRNKITKSLKIHGVDVMEPKMPGKLRKDATIPVHLQFGNIATVPIQVTPNGAVKDIAAKSPFMQQTILNTLSKLQNAPAWRNNGRRVGGSRKTRNMRRLGNRRP